MVEAHNEMRAVGETVTVPLTALALTNDGEAAAYLHTEPDEPSDDDGERGGLLPEEPIVAENEDAGRGSIRLPNLGDTARFGHSGQVGECRVRTAQGGTRRQ